MEYDENLRVDEVEKAIKAIAEAIMETEKMNSEEANSTIQLLGLSAPAKKVEIKAMSGENATIMGELRSLRYDVERMHMLYSTGYRRRIINDEYRTEEPAANGVSPDDVRRRRTGFRPYIVNGEKDKEE